MRGLILSRSEDPAECAPAIAAYLYESAAVLAWTVDAEPGRLRVLLGPVIAAWLPQLAEFVRLNVPRETFALAGGGVLGSSSVPNLLPRWLRALLLLLSRLLRPVEGVRAEITVGMPFNLPRREEIHRMATTERKITTTQGFRLHFIPRKTDGSPATVDGIPVWNITQDDQGLLVFEVAPDGMSALVKSNGTAGHATADVHVTADADLDLDETRLVSAIVDLSVSVTPAEAASADLEVGEVEDLSPTPAIDQPE